MANSNQKVQKIRITSIDQLQEGDVLLCIWRKGLERNATSSTPLPEVNYRQICVVTEITKLNNGKMVFHHRFPSNLHSNNGDHVLVQKAISYNAYATDPKTACTTSSFGCNHGIEGYEIYKLTEVKSRPNAGFQQISLKGNPSYDLMM